MVKTQLYTPVGLKSFSSKDVHYLQDPGGDQRQGDSTYHQGTVWSWLLGPYIEASIKVKSQQGKTAGRKSSITLPAN